MQSSTPYVGNCIFFPSLQYARNTYIFIATTVWHNSSVEFKRTAMQNRGKILLWSYYAYEIQNSMNSLFTTTCIKALHLYIWTNIQMYIFSNIFLCSLRVEIIFLLLASAYSTWKMSVIEIQSFNSRLRTADGENTTWALLQAWPRNYFLFNCFRTYDIILCLKDKNLSVIR